MNLIYQIQNGLNKNLSKNDTVTKSTLSDLYLRSSLERKPDMNIASLSKILWSYFKEPYSTALFTALSNSKQEANEWITEICHDVDVVFVIKEVRCSYSEELTQNHFTYAVLIGLQNENIRNELHPIFNYLKKNYWKN